MRKTLRYDGFVNRWTLRLLIAQSLLLAGAAHANADRSDAATKAAAPKSAESECSIVVLNLHGNSLVGSDQELPKTLTESLVSEIASASGCRVISEEDIKSMLELEAHKAQCGETSDSCLAEIGAAFGAQRAVSGTVGRVGSDYLLAARLVDVKTAQVVARAEETVQGGREGLVVASKNLGRTLFDQAPLPRAERPQEAKPKGTSALFYGGVALASVGGLLLGTGAVVAGVAEARMADPSATGKGPMQTMGVAGLIGAGVGVLVGAGGGGLLAMGMGE
jgi:TolB-like protein